MTQRKALPTTAPHGAYTGSGAPMSGDALECVHSNFERPQAPSPERLLKAEQVADRWQVPAAHVYRLAREGCLPVVMLGRYRRFRVDEIERFERAGGAAPNV